MTPLNDEEAFPTYRDCPIELEIPYPRDHYRELEGGGFVPIRHWCFLGEITESVVFTRLCLEVKDKIGKVVTASFYLDSPGLGGRFTPGMSNSPVHPNIPESLTKKGNTIAILYPDQHEFADGSIGFRIEKGEFVQVGPILLEENLFNGRPVFPLFLETTTRSRRSRFGRCFSIGRCPSLLQV